MGEEWGEGVRHFCFSGGKQGCSASHLSAVVAQSPTTLGARQDVGHCWRH